MGFGAAFAALRRRMHCAGPAPATLAAMARLHARREDDGAAAHACALQAAALTHMLS